MCHLQINTSIISHRCPSASSYSCFYSYRRRIDLSTFETPQQFFGKHFNRFCVRSCYWSPLSSDTACQVAIINNTSPWIIIPEPTSADLSKDLIMDPHINRTKYRAIFPFKPHLHKLSSASCQDWLITIKYGNRHSAPDGARCKDGVKVIWG